MGMMQSLQQSQSNIISSDNFLVSLSDVLIPEKTLLITSPGFSRRGLVTKIIAHFSKCDFVIYDTVTPNPELVNLKQIVKSLAPKSIVQIIALGGGSVIDSGKVLGCLLANPGIELDVLLQTPADDLVASIPVVAIPTTSGTGAEVTPFATVWDSDSQKKFSLLNVKPRFAILDPNLTLTLPAQDTLYPALDALSHALESLWNINRTEDSQVYATQAIDNICESLPQVLKQAKNLVARKALQEAASLAGLAISQTKTAIAHAISYPLTLKYGLPHGLACSFTIPTLIAYYGADELKLEARIADKILELFKFLDLDAELTKFMSKNSLEQNDLETLESSRLDNFLHKVDGKLASELLNQSLKNLKAGPIL